MPQKTDLSELESVIAGVLAKLPATKQNLDDPEKDGDPYHLIFFHGGNEIAVDWLPSIGFQVYAEGEKPEPGEHTDTHVTAEDCVLNVVSQLGA